jgi:hypothetical protein
MPSMNRIIVSAISISTFVLSVSIQSTSAMTSQNDPCRAKAIEAAEAAYGLAPYRSTIRTIVEGQSYKVYVGIGNPESGEDLYDVTFTDGCNSPAMATEAPEVPINSTM